VNGGTTAGKGTNSLDLVLEQAHTERAWQLRHFDALDGKSGVLLGFSAALVALAPSHHLVVGIGRVVAVVAGLVSLSGFWPRGFRAIDLYSLRMRYLAQTPC